MHFFKHTVNGLNEHWLKADKQVDIANQLLTIKSCLWFHKND